MRTKADRRAHATGEIPLSSVSITMSKLSSCQVMQLPQRLFKGELAVLRIACVLADASVGSLEGGQPVDASVISVKSENSKTIPLAGPSANGSLQVAVFVWLLWCDFSVLSKPLLCTAVGYMLHLQTPVSL